MMGLVIADGKKSGLNILSLALIDNRAIAL